MTARARWKIESESFKTLQSEAGGYRKVHNFGHGHHNRSHVFANLAIMAFFLEQIVEHYCDMVQRDHNRYPTKKYLWESMQRIFIEFFIARWNHFYREFFVRNKRGLT